MEYIQKDDNCPKEGRRMLCAGCEHNNGIADADGNSGILCNYKDDEIVEEQIEYKMSDATGRGDGIYLLCQALNILGYEDLVTDFRRIKP